MPTRIRTRTVNVGTGQAIALNPSLTTSTISWSKSQYMSDVVGNRFSPNPLFATSVNSVNAVVNGDIPTYWRCVNYPRGGGFSVSSMLAQAPTKPRPSNNSLLSQGLAQTNPNRSDADLPRFVWELSEIPRMLRRWGSDLIKRPSFSGKENLHSLPRAIAENYVEYQFGVAPFIQDLQKILQFQKNVEGRLQQLDKLSSGDGAHNSGTVYSDTKIADGGTSYFTPLYMEFRQFQWQTLVNRKSWVSTTWTPTEPVPKTPEDRYALAVRIAYGLDISFATLWEVMPWSWFIDWFSNIGDSYRRLRNSMPVKRKDTCLMHRTDAHLKIVRVISSVPATIRPLEPATVQLERIVLGEATPSLEFHLPFLTGSQSAIIGSLNILRDKNLSRYR